MKVMPCITDMDRISSFHLALSSKVLCKHCRIAGSSISCPPSHRPGQAQCLWQGAMHLTQRH